MKILLIAGAGGHGKVIADIAIQTKKYTHIYFMDDADVGNSILGMAVIGKIETEFSIVQDMLKKYIEVDSNFLKKENIEVIVSIGNSKIREEKQTAFELAGYQIATLIHPSAVMGYGVQVGMGSVVMPQVVINAGTSVGKGCIINTSASVDHDNIIEEYCHVSVGSHLAGTIHVGKHTWIGIGAIVSNNLCICEECMIGAGAVVIRDIQDKGTYVGVPAKLLIK